MSSRITGHGGPGGLRTGGAFYGSGGPGRLVRNGQRRSDRDSQPHEAILASNIAIRTNANLVPLTGQSLLHQKTFNQRGA